GVADVAGPGKPAMAAGDAVELVAVHHQQQAAVGAPMDGFPQDENVPELQVAEAAEILVVVAGGQRDHAAPLRLGEDRADHVAVELRPVGPALEAPEVDDVAHQVEELALAGVQEGQQGLRLTVPSSQVNVAQPYGAQASWGHVRRSPSGAPW